MHQNLAFDYIQQNQSIRQATTTWLTDIAYEKGFHWNYFFTLTFRSPINEYNEVHKIVTKFYKTLNNKIFGSRSRKALRIATFIEKSEYHGYHIHVICENPQPRLITTKQRINAGSELLFKNTLEKLWNQADKRTGKPDFNGFSSSFQTIDDPERLFQYTTKELYLDHHEAINYTILNFDGYQLDHI